MASCVNVYAGSVASDELVSGTLVPTANRRHLIAITIHRGDSTSVATPSVSLWGLSWSLVESVLWDDTSGSRRGLFVFTAVTGGSPSSGALTVTSLAVPEIEISVVVDRIEGDIDGSIVQAKSHGIGNDVSNLIDVTLDSAPGSNANMWTALGFVRDNGADNSITTDGFAVSAEAHLEDEAGVATGFRASGSQTVQWLNIDSNSVIRTKGAVLVEIDATTQQPTIYSVTPDEMAHGTTVVIEWGPPE